MAKNGSLSLEEFINKYKDSTGKAIASREISEYLDMGLLPDVILKEGELFFNSSHVERIRMIKHLRFKYHMSAEDIAGIIAIKGAGKAEKTDQEISRRDLIINSASNLFSERGYRGTTVDDIAREAGIAKGTFYIYFESKESLLSEVMDHTTETTIERINRRLANSMSTVERLAVINEEYDKTWKHNIELIFVLIGESVGNPRISKQMWKLYEKLAGPVRKAIESGEKSGEIANFNNSRAIAFALLGIAQLISYYGIVNPANLDKDWEAIKKFIEKGLMP